MTKEPHVSDQALNKIFAHPTSTARTAFNEALDDLAAATGVNKGALVESSKTLDWPHKVDAGLTPGEARSAAQHQLGHIMGRSHPDDLQGTGAENKSFASRLPQPKKTKADAVADSKSNGEITR